MMKSLALFVLAAFATAGPSPNTDPASAIPCKNPKVRKEWRSLSVDERKRYIKAAECMFAKPPVTKSLFPIVTNRYEDFVVIHSNATSGGTSMIGKENDPSASFFAAFNPNGIHSNGVFLPWHRYFITVWEDAIQKECGWDQPMPYWDWSLEAPEAGGAWLSSPVFDTEAGFGGNGAKVAADGLSSGKGFPAGLPPFLQGKGGNSPGKGGQLPDIAAIFGNADPIAIETAMGGTGGGCVMAGPFKDIKLHIGPMGKMDPKNIRCLRRNFNPRLGEQVTKEAMRALINNTSFGNLRMSIEMPFTMSGGAPFHTVGHQGVGGEMGDLFTSTNDPLFFLHHAGLDRLWAMWQEFDTKKRLYDVSNPAGPTGPPFMPQPNPLTLETPIWMGFAAPDRPVRDVMDTMNRDGKGFLCYKYDKGAEMYL